MSEPINPGSPAAALPDTLLQLLTGELRREWRNGLKGVGLMLLITLLLACGIPFAKTMTAGGNLDLAPGLLVAIRHYPNERREVGVYAFTDQQGHPRTATSSMEPGARRIGEQVEILYSLEDAQFARPLNSGERFLYGFLVGITACLAMVAACMLAWVWRVRRVREQMLRDGWCAVGSSPRIRFLQVPLPYLPQQWCLCVSHFDERNMLWREYRSSWRTVPEAQLHANTPIPPTLFDTRKPARYWQALGRLDPARG